MRAFTINILARMPRCPPSPLGGIRSMTTSLEYVASRARDPVFEKFMDKYKNFLKVVAIQDLILSSTRSPPSVSLDFLSRLSQKLHLNRGAAVFLKKYPHVFDIFCDPSCSKPFCRLTDAASQISLQDSQELAANIPHAIDRLVRILSMSSSRSVPLRAVFKVWRELGLPDDFEDSVISRNPNLFQLFDGPEPNTHILKLVNVVPDSQFSSAIDNWRIQECCRENTDIDRTGLQFSFKHSYPPGMKLNSAFKKKVKEWQRVPYIGPYDEFVEGKSSKTGARGKKKRAVGIVHEFLSLTVEKMVEVEKISHFGKSFGIDSNIRDLFLDHPGIFYLSTKGKRHTVFLREAYKWARLVEPNPVYDVRMKLFHLVLMERRGLSQLSDQVSIIKSAQTNFG